MMEAEFSLMGMRFWLVDVASHFSNSLIITECIPWKKKGGQAMFSFKDPHGEAGAILTEISHNPDVLSVEMISQEEDQVTASVAMRECLWIWKVVDSGCFLEGAWSDGDGAMNIKILAGSEGSIPRFIRSMNMKGVEVEINKISKISERRDVTAKQERVLRIALDNGYFDYPRKIKLRELAKLCGMNIATVDEIVKRGQKNIVQHYFRNR